MDFFSRQVVFVTGSTGGLGACLLYKLTVVLQVPKIYVLIRKTPDEAFKTWQKTIPNQVDEILRNGQVHLVQGDLTMPQFGIDETLLGEMEQEVTVVINSAASISLRMNLRDIVMVNCLPALELAGMALKFAKLQCFLQVSTAYALTDKSGGTVEERIYPMSSSAHQVLEDVISGRSDDSSEFLWPYGKSKRLMEVLLTERFSRRLPLLIVRPSQIGPAIKEPYALYMPMSACPMSSWSSRLMYPVGGTVLFGVEDASLFGQNVVDEIPVDLVSNVILQHIQRGTIGVVNASAQLFVPRTFNQFLQDIHCAVPDRWRRRLPVVACTTNPSAEQSELADLYRIHTRDYLILTERSRGLDLDGPIGLDLRGFDIEDYAARRMQHIYAETVKVLERKGKEKQNKEPTPSKF
ncbi:Fatty acyl-CoA reductase [Venustampulla echinocandica]|uniref:Fatty acyl-CoA reductase n=1 Tax=Venustampulla echinocandica TaxID=2656787 RepID=A0A370TJR7_9HELO|nr:Fatty acyl-CoA reductase [Venustampulla echinocandica]RDL35764.1 Fatty acyl-CoA reductase [Venustampulla echinocandica]